MSQFLKRKKVGVTVEYLLHLLNADFGLSGTCMNLLHQSQTVGFKFVYVVPPVRPRVHVKIHATVHRPDTRV